MSAAPRAVVVRFPGSNGHRDLVEALGRAGFAVEEQGSELPVPAGVALVGLPGGFSYGDYWRAGCLARRAPAVTSLAPHVARGGLVIGICNGFQILCEAGLLDGALGANRPLGFRHGWTECEVARSPSPFFAGIPAGTVLRMPYAHGEGCLTHSDGYGAIAARVPLKYKTNPNGSLGAAAGLLDGTGRVLGLMPHPERASDPHLGSSDGLRLFAAAASWLRDRPDLAPPASPGSRTLTLREVVP